MSLLALAKLSRFVAALFDECTTDEEAEAILQTLPEDKQHLINKLKLFYEPVSSLELMNYVATFSYEEIEFLDSQVLDIYRKLTPAAHSLKDIVRHISADKRPRFEALDYVFERGFFSMTQIHTYLDLFIRECIKYENLTILEKLNDKYCVSNIYDYYSEIPTNHSNRARDYTSLHLLHAVLDSDTLLGPILINNNCSIDTIRYCLEKIDRFYIYALILSLRYSSNIKYIKFLLDNREYLEKIQMIQAKNINARIDSLFIMPGILRHLAIHVVSIPKYVEAGFDIYKHANTIINLCSYRGFRDNVTITISKKLMDILAKYNITYDKAALIQNRNIPLESLEIVIK